jgi:hypothetical protein
VLYLLPLPLLLLLVAAAVVVVVLLLLPLGLVVEVVMLVLVVALLVLVVAVLLLLRVVVLLVVLLLLLFLLHVVVVGPLGHRHVLQSQLALPILVPLSALQLLVLPPQVLQPSARMLQSTQAPHMAVGRVVMVLTPSPLTWIQRRRLQPGHRPCRAMTRPLCADASSLLQPSVEGRAWVRPRHSHLLLIRRQWRRLSMMVHAHASLWCLWPWPYSASLQPQPQLAG